MYITVTSVVQLNTTNANIVSNSHLDELWTSDGTACEYGNSHICTRLLTKKEESKAAKLNVAFLIGF